MDDPGLLQALDQIENVAGTVASLARLHGVTADAEPIDEFVGAAARLSDAEIELDDTEMLMVKLQRAGVINDQQGFALHVAYLHQKAASADQAEPLHVAPTR